MVFKLLMALGLMAFCVIVHAVGLSGAIHWLRRSGTRIALPDAHFWPSLWMLIRIATWIIFLHLLQISVWAACYTWQQSMPDFQSAFYFSAVTYTTTGYGDLVLPPDWRLVGGIEALTGILMCGLSTGFFFAALTKHFGVRTE